MSIFYCPKSDVPSGLIRIIFFSGRIRENSSPLSVRLPQVQDI